MKSYPLFAYDNKVHDDDVAHPTTIDFPLDTFKDKTYLTHNFHPYPAKFVPQIPRNVILALSRRHETIMDPFCGSGTSLVEANLCERQAVGLDINPLACLISRAKTTHLTHSQLEQIRRFSNELREVQSKIGLGTCAELDELELPVFLNRDHWFPGHVSKELAIIKSRIFSLADLAVQDFLKVALSAIIVKVSNQDSDTRWVAVRKNIEPGHTINTFRNKLGSMITRIEEYGVERKGTSQVFEMSMREASLIPDESIDLIVTSPPYPNSYDYYLYHKLRFFWLDMDHRPTQKKEIGSRHRHSDKGEGIETYSDEMVKILVEMGRVLKPMRWICVIIGDAILKGELLEMDRLFYSYTDKLELSHAHTFSYDQRKYSSAFTRNLKTAAKKSHIMFFQKIR